jgi:alkylation response protein AidB-like acyl-CoA dehydrogenase
MQTAFTAEQEELRQYLRRYMAGLMTPELRHELETTYGNEGGGPLYRAALRRMGADRLIGLGWPVELGGKGHGPIEQYIFIEEVTRSGFPFPYLTSESMGPAIAEFGSPEIRKELLPKILGGEVVIAIGYTEPGAGTDLAALKTRAERQGDEYVINGAKVFTSLGHFADYIWLAVRTAHDEKHPRHKGLSLILVPTNSQGFSHAPIHTVADGHTNQTFYDNVRVPARNLIGKENGGWAVITSQLNRERLTLMNPGIANLMYSQTLEYVLEDRDGVRLIDQAWVQMNMARIFCALKALNLACRKQAWGIAQGTLTAAEASAVKILGYETFLATVRQMLEVLGPEATLRRGSTGVPLNGMLDVLYRTVPIYGFAGGANEVMRDMVAQLGMGLPRVKRA